MCPVCGAFRIDLSLSQRDERQGWMADASVSAEQAIHNFNMHSEVHQSDTCMRDVVSLCRFLCIMASYYERRPKHERQLL
jgi:hypothetical protein